MILYKYKIIDNWENVLIGSVFAINKEDLLNKLQLNNETIVYIKKQKEKIKKPIEEFTLLFFKNLYPLISKKLDISTSLYIVSNLFKNMEEKAIVDSILHSISIGISLSKSLAVFEKYFDDLIIKSIEVSETTATLDITILNIIEYLETRVKLKSNIKNAILYPILLFCVMFSVFIFWIIFIVPNFVDLFNDIGIKLPFSAKMMMSLRSFLVCKSWIMFLIIAILLHSKIVLNHLKDFMLKVPLFRAHVRDQFSMRFFCSMKIMLKEKINLIEALNCFSQNKNDYNISSVAEIIKNGSTLSIALRSLNLFHEHELAIIKAGEKSGMLWQSFETVTNLLQTRMKTRAERIVGLVQPVSIIFIGTLLVVVIYSVFAP
ncbi:MAG: type II secretion system F family protein, partial [Holosporales bacterium]|nr:type II secretion system F family protein [Holosporales bacterium]